MNASRTFSKPIPVLFQDDVCVVFDKPAGLLVIPTPRGEDNTLVNIVNHQYAESGKSRLYPCHRLDRETSGCILFAKSKRFQQRLMSLFHGHQIHKEYIAVVQGRMNRHSGVLTSDIVSYDKIKHGKTSSPRMAKTRYRVISIRKNFSVLSVEPITGRTNQIRIQFARIGHPLVGDRKYSKVKIFPIKFKRTALHASQIAWQDSETKKHYQVQSPLPKDMEVLIG